MLTFAPLYSKFTKNRFLTSFYGDVYLGELNPVFRQAAKQNLKAKVK
jgi:hypothetical protein